MQSFFYFDSIIMKKRITQIRASIQLGVWFTLVVIYWNGLTFAASTDILVPFWGSDLSPIDNIGWRIALQLDQFTELNNDTLRFPIGRKTNDCDYYCETIGFNTVQGTRTLQLQNDFRLSIGMFLGVANDDLTEFLQNDYSHRKNGIDPVPRQGVREGILAGTSLEVDRDIISKWLFGGTGLLLNNVYHEWFLHSGLKLQRQSLFDSKFGLKYSTTMRLSFISNSREYLITGKPYFSILSPIIATGQAEIGLYTSLFNVPIEFSWRGGYSSGVFINQDRDKPEGMWLEGLKTVIWKFSFERYNDALNGTDYGPTYGVKMDFTF